MKKLQRVYETAEEEGRPVEDVARERYDTLTEFEEAQEEKRIVAEREQRRLSRSQSSNNPSGGRLDSRGEKRWMFTDVGNPDSRPSSRTSFRRPGTGSDTAPSTPQPQPESGTSPGTPGPSSIPRAKRVDTLRQGRSSTSGSGSSSPIPSVLTPSAHTTGKRALSPSSLNKLQARVLKAKLMGAADATELERQFEAERARANSGTTSGVVQADGTRVEVLPTLDGRGRLYDVGSGKDDPTLLPGNRKKKDKVGPPVHFVLVKFADRPVSLTISQYVETRDPKTGEVLRINADDDSVTLGDMLRQERFGAGMADQKNLDAELAGAIMGDGKFEVGSLLMPSTV
jgi:CWF19-like protein 2